MDTSGLDKLQHKYSQSNQYRQRLTKDTYPQASQHPQYTAHADLPNRPRIHGPRLRDDGRLGLGRVPARQIGLYSRKRIAGITAYAVGVSQLVCEEGCREDEGCAEHEAAAETGEEKGHG